MLATAGAKLTVAVTAGWVERTAAWCPFREVPRQARTLRHGRERGLLGSPTTATPTGAGGRARPRLFSGNRPYHREFYDRLPGDVHREHLRVAQDILGSWFGAPIETLVPWQRPVLEDRACAPAAGIRSSRLGGRPTATRRHLRDDAVVAFHDRIVGAGFASSEGNSPIARGPPVTVGELGRQQAARR